jgi:hypothetical protein
VQSELDLELAHKHASRHREEVLASDICGCFYCQSTFRPSDIETWVDKGQTALCPRCGIDSVIGSAAGYSLSGGFLAVMYDYWF